MSFDDAAIRTLFDQVTSHAGSLGLFEWINSHEPKSKPPGNGLSCSFWVDLIRPLPEVSGLASTAGLVVFHARIMKSFMAKPEDDIDKVVLGAAVKLIGAYSRAFTLGGNVIDVDLLGEHGEPLGAEAAYVEQDGTRFRAMIVTLPIVIDSLWTQAP